MEQQPHSDRIPLLDYHQRSTASDLVLPQAAVVSSLDRWADWHFEVQQQPAHDTGEHLHQMHIITLVTSPTPITQTIDGRSERNLAGCVGAASPEENRVFILPAGAVHRCEWHQEIEFMFVGIDPQSLLKIGAETLDRDRIELMPQFATSSDPLVRGILSAFQQETIAPGLNTQLFVEQLQITLAMHLIRSYGVRQVPSFTHKDGLSSQQLARVKDYIDAHLELPLGLAELARQAGISQFYFSRAFKRSLGITPHQYVIAQRVERAKKLIRQCKLSLVEIALECGFANQGHLNWHIKRLTGATPKQIARICEISKNL